MQVNFQSASTKFDSYYGNENIYFNGRGGGLGNRIEEFKKGELQDYSKLPFWENFYFHPYP